MKSFVTEVRKLHRSDVKNEIRRKESLGYNFKTENLQPKSFREPLVTKDNKPVDKYYLTAFVPVLKETFRAEFNGCKRPKYIKLEDGENWMRDTHAIGLITAAPISQVPPVTICEQLNDLRVDDHFNHVYTYVFQSLNPETMRVEVHDPAEEIRVLKSQDFERQFNKRRNSEK